MTYKVIAHSDLDSFADPAARESHTTTMESAFNNLEREGWALQLVRYPDPPPHGMSYLAYVFHKPNE